MTISTQFTWDPISDAAQVEQMNNKIAEMVAQGKTNGTYTSNWINQYPNPPMICSRPWTTVADAQEWIDFCNSLPTLPEHVELIEQ